VIPLRAATALLALGLTLAGTPVAEPAAPAVTAAAPDGSADFDLEIGRWRTVVQRLRTPLSGSNDWVEYEGTSVVHRFIGGRANLVELSIDGPAGSIEGVSLRLYHPQSRQWSIHWASARDGELTAPVFGQFDNGRGEFYGDDTFDGRPIGVRFVISAPAADRLRFEQAFSADGGRTWEVNWIATDTRLRSRWRSLRSNAPPTPRSPRIGVSDRPSRLLAADSRVLGARNQPPEINAADVDQFPVISGLEIDVLRVREGLVDHHIDAVCRTERRDGARFAVGEQRRDFTFGCEAERAAEMPVHRSEVDPPGRGYDRHEISPVVLQHRALGQMSPGNVGGLRGVSAVQCPRMIDEVIADSFLLETPLHGCCDGHDGHSCAAILILAPIYSRPGIITASIAVLFELTPTRSSPAACRRRRRPRARRR
jgi:hypothetical protein